MKKFFSSILRGINAIVNFSLGLILVLIVLVLYIPLRVIFPTRIIGRKNLRRLKGGKIVAPNHFSNFDGILMIILFYPFAFTRKFLAKVELAKSKVLAYILKSFGAIFINRQKLDMKAMKEATNTLKEGKTLIMFPEGTRNKTGDEETQDLKGGVIFFANRANAYIIPVLILHKPRPFRLNKIIVSEGYKIDNSVKCNTEAEIEKLSGIYKDLRTEYSNKKENK